MIINYLKPLGISRYSVAVIEYSLLALLSLGGLVAITQLPVGDPLSLVLPAVIVASWMYGIIGGVVATALGAVFGTLVFRSIHPDQWSLMLRASTFPYLGAVLSFAAGHCRRVNTKAERALRDKSAALDGETAANLKLQQVVDQQAQFNRILKQYEDLLHRALGILKAEHFQFTITDQSTGIEPDQGKIDLAANILVAGYEPAFRVVRSAIVSTLNSDRGFDVRFSMGAGDLYWKRCIGCISPDSAGCLVLSGLNIDISAEVALERDLQAARCQAEAANSRKSEFIAAVSHEIRTPLTAICGFSDLIYDEAEPASEFRTYAGIIKRNSEYVTKLVNDVLDIAKIDSGRLELATEPVNVREVVQDVLFTLGNQARDKGLTLTAEFDNIPETILTDSVRLRQILLNVVGNAVKFTEAGSVEMHVSSEPPLLESDSWKVYFTVRDTGIGLLADEVSRVFEPFTQANRSINREYGGTGLGLAIARKLAQALGGDLHLKSSRPGRGSTFEIVISARPLQPTLSGMAHDEFVIKRVPASAHSHTSRPHNPH